LNSEGITSPRATFTSTDERARTVRELAGVAFPLDHPGLIGALSPPALAEVRRAGV